MAAMTTPNAVLFIGVLLIVWSLLRAHRDRHNWRDLQERLRGDDGRIRRGAVLLLGSFGMGSWVVWKMASAGTLTGEIFIGFCTVFAAPAITKLVVNAGIDIS